MKVVFNDEFNFVVFLNNIYIDSINFDNKVDLEKYFRKIFSNLHAFYDIEINGYYDIKVYHDNNYGIIIELKKSDSDYFDYLDNQIDMRITNAKSECFLYKINDYFLYKNIKGCEYYLYKTNIYVKIKTKISKSDYFYLLENSEIIYNEEVNNILKYGKQIKKGWYNENANTCPSRKTKCRKVNYIQ